MIKQQFAYKFSVIALICYCGIAAFKICASDKILSSEKVIQQFNQANNQKKGQMFHSLLRKNEELLKIQKTQNISYGALHAENEGLKNSIRMQSHHIATSKKYTYCLMGLSALSTITLILYSTYSTMYSDSSINNATCAYMNN